jgi:hypothetical protein
MDPYEMRKERLARLRKIILHSSDALPERVAAYIDRTSKQRTAWDEKELILKEYGPVAEHLPRRFVDFALGYLIEERAERDFFLSDPAPDRLGVRWVNDYFPAAPLQGPFLFLLRKHESEGLRLIHGLVNAATSRWREAEQSRGILGTPRSPIPVYLSLASGEKLFWGDDRVYCWYRGTGTGPVAVISALMALEMWIEEQLATGRDGTELFQTVLAGSESVSVLGVLVSAALSYPGRCLDAVEPLVVSPRLWRMDIDRRTDDLSGTPINDSLDRYGAINRILSERNKLPHRATDIRALVPSYLLNRDRKSGFEEKVRSFEDVLPLQFEEEAGDAPLMQKLRDRMAGYQAHLNAANYRLSPHGEEQLPVEFVPPPKLVERDREHIDEHSRIKAWLATKLWAKKSLDEGTLAEGMTAAEAIQTARSMQREGDFSTPSSTLSDGFDQIRLEAIVEVAAAVLADPSRPVLEPDELAWLRSVLLGAARMPRGGPVIPESHHPSDVKVSAALGLGALVTQGQDDQEIREAILLLIVDSEHQVVGAAFRGLRQAWTIDPVLCWNSLSLALSTCCIPRTGVKPFSGLALNDSGWEWLVNLWNAHLERLRDGTIPDIPVIPDRETASFQSERVAHLLGPLPVRELGAERVGKERILLLLDRLMAKTLELGQSIKLAERSHSIGHHRWEMNFLRWSARVANILSLDEEEDHILRQIRATWPDQPRLLEQLLLGYLGESLGKLDPFPDQAVVTWGRLWGWLLETPELRALGRRPTTFSDAEKIVTLAVFVTCGRYFYKETWPLASRFEALIDRWVRTVGANHDCYQALVTMLKANVLRFDPGKILDWLELIRSGSADVRALWAAHENGVRTTELLALVRTQRADDFDLEGLTRKLTTLVDALAAASVPAASLLQRQLDETRTPFRHPFPGDST